MPPPRPKPPLAHVGRQIAAQRKELWMNKEGLAQAADVSPSSIARIERGKDVRASTYLAVVGFLQRRHGLGNVNERVAVLPKAARERILALIEHFETRA